MIWNNGKKYEGDFVKGMRDGLGEANWNGHRYIG